MRSTFVLRTIITVWLLAYASALTAAIIFRGYTSIELFTLIFATLGACSSGWLLYRGFESASAMVLLSMAWITTSLFLITRGGIRLPILSFYALIVVASIFLIGKRTGLFVALLTFFATLFTAWLELQGMLPELPMGAVLPRYLFVNLFFLILITVITYLIAADVEHSFALAHTAAASARERQTELEDRTAELEAANAELAISERRYRHFFSGTPVMMHSIDQQGVLIDVNEFWLKTLGYEQDEVIGRRSTEFLTPESQRYALEEILPLYFENGFIKDVSYKMVKKSGEVIDVLLSASELLDEEGKFLHSLASIVDVTQQKQAEAELRESEQRFRTLVNSAADCFLLLNRRGELIGVNDYACQILGYSRNEFLGMSMEKFSDWTPAKMLGLAETMELNVPQTISSTLIRKDGVHIPSETRVVITTIDNEPVYLGLARDISERKSAELALQASEHRFRSLVFNQAQQFIGLVELDGTLSEANRSALEFGDVLREEVVGQHFWDTPWWNYDPQVREQLIQAIQVAKQGQNVAYEVEVRGGNGALMTVDFSLTPIRNEDGEVALLLAEGRNITELHRSALALAKSVQEKELLLKEIHHRVKNNLQIVSSILRLQAGKLEDENILFALNESQSRIRSMQLIHEQLYQSDNVASVNLAEYCKSLAAEASRLYRAPSTQIDFQMDLADIDLNVDVATTCGLILHEMISNAIKYAFPEGTSGIISIQLRNLDDQKLYLSVEDNGIGISPEIPFPSPSSLGFRLIQLLSAQIQATVQLIREPTTKFELVFELDQ